MLFRIFYDLNNCHPIDIVCSCFIFKGQKKLTVSWHTPNRVNNYKVTISTFTQFVNASGLPGKYLLTPSHPNTMSYPILDEE